MTKAIIYTRFSERPDSKTSESCEYQRELCEKWCAKKGYEVAGCYEDKGKSGKSTIEEREGLGKAITSLKSGYALVVYNWDRLARDRMVHVAIESFVISKNCHMESVMNGASTKKESPEDELVRSIMQSLSGYQRQINAIRTSEAMKQHQKRGRRMGSVHPYGFKADPKDPRMMVEHPKEQKAIARMLELREEGMGWRNIAKTLKDEGYKPRKEKWHFSSIRRIVEKATA